MNVEDKQGLHFDGSMTDTLLISLTFCWDLCCTTRKKTARKCLDPFVSVKKKLTLKSKAEILTNMAQTQTFSIPMANMNLAPSEALNQIMDNLNHLNIIVNQAVNTIQSRIKEESLLLSSISKRVEAAFQKLN